MMPAEGAPGATAHRTRAIAALIVTYAFFGILLNSVGTVILQSIATMGVDARNAAVLEAFKDLPIAVVSFALASLLPRFGYRRAMIFGIAGAAVGCAMMPLAPSFATTKLLFLLIGSSFALVKTGTYATIGLLTETPREHAALTNLIEGLFMVGVLSGYWVFAYFIDARAPGSLGWLNVYWLLLAVALLDIVLLLASPIDERQALAPVSNGVKDDIAQMLGLLASTTVATFVISAFVYVLIEQSVGTWLPTFNAKVLHLSQPMSIQAASVYAAMLAVGRLLAGPLIRRTGWLPLLLGCVAGIIMVVLVAVPMATAHPPRVIVDWRDAPLATYAMPLIGLFLAPIYPTINSAILSSLPRTRQAAMTGLIIVFSALGGTSGSFVTGRVFAAFGGLTAFQLIVLPSAVLGLLLIWLRRQLARTAAR